MNKEAIIERQANENLKLVNNNIELRQRINKAIEVLKNLSENEYYYKYNNKYLKSEIIDNLLSILKGEE